MSSFIKCGRLPPPSFRQLLLLAFSGIILLLGGALARTLVVVHSLTQSMEAYPETVLQEVESVRALQESTVNLEREARQYLVLNDAGLRHQLTQDWLHAQQEATLLRIDFPQGLGSLTQQWVDQGNQTLTPILTGADPQHIDSAVLFEGFRQLAEMNLVLRQQSTLALTARTQQLMSDLEAQRHTLMLLGAAAASVAALLALGLGGWLSRSLRGLDQAISALALSPPGPSHVVHGPRDLRALGARIEGVRQHLLALEADKQQFLRHISHELKTPLSNLREGIALLGDQVAGTLNEGQREIMGILEDNVRALQQQIESLLQYNAATFQALQLKPRPLELRAVLHRLIEGQRLLLQGQQLQVTVEGGPLWTQADPEKLDMLLSNLLSNAIRFSPPGGQIRFTLRLGEGQVWLDCEDQGPGVAFEDRERIFEPFYQGQRQPAGARRGSGIGLSIVRELVRAHGGQVSLLEQTQGAHFRVILPQTPRQALAGPESQENNS